MRIRNVARLELLFELARELELLNPGIWPRACVRLDAGRERHGAVLVAGDHVAILLDLPDPTAARELALELVAADHLVVDDVGLAKGVAA